MAIRADVRPAAVTSRPARLTLTVRERGRLLRRVAVPMESLSAYSVSTSPEFAAFQPVLLDELSDEVYRGVRRATVRALRNYLLEVTDLERKIEIWIDSRRGGTGAVPGSGGSGRVRFDVGLHRFVPEAQMRYEMPHGSLKFVLGAQGAVGVRFRADGMQRSEISLGFDGDEAYRLGLRFGF